MKKIALSLIVLFAAVSAINAQKYFTKTGDITFISSTSMEKIEAENNAATCVIDVTTGNMQMAVLIKAFKFEKALMQEHFNENYMESSKYPKATFKGKIANMDDVDFEKDDTYSVQIVGKLTIHGVTKDVETDGEIIIKNGLPIAKSVFSVAVADYNIEIPKVVRDNIAKEVEIDVDLKLEELKM